MVLVMVKLICLVPPKEVIKVLIMLIKGQIMLTFLEAKYKRGTPKGWLECENRDLDPPFMVRIWTN